MAQFMACRKRIQTLVYVNTSVSGFASYLPASFDPTTLPSQVTQRPHQTPNSDYLGILLKWLTSFFLLILFLFSRIILIPMSTLISIAGWREWWRLSGSRLSSLPLALLLPPSFSGRHEMHTEHCTLPSARSMLRHGSSSPQALRDEYGLFQLTSFLHLAALNSLRTRPPPPYDSLVHPRRLSAPKMPSLWSTTVRPAELSPSPVVGTCSEERSMPRRDLFKAPTRGNRPKQNACGAGAVALRLSRASVTRAWCPITPVLSRKRLVCCTLGLQPGGNN